MNKKVILLSLIAVSCLLFLSEALVNGQLGKIINDFRVARFDAGNRQIKRGAAVKFAEFAHFQF